MFNVMVVDDDFPVLEFMTKSIHWEKLGFHLQGAYKSGPVALEHMRETRPDLLITDIEMPEMNGLELIQAAKALNSKLLIIIISCHDDFKYAQQAVKLDVFDYMLKDTLEPNSVVELLSRIQQRMSELAHMDQIGKQFKQFANENESILKTKFLRSLISRTWSNPAEWALQGKQFGLDFNHCSYIPVLGHINRHTEAKRKFSTEDSMLFAVENIVDEVLSEQAYGVRLGYNSREFFLFFPHYDRLNFNSYERIYRVLEVMKNALWRFLKISVSFVLNDHIHEIRDIKDSVVALLNSRSQLFYEQKSFILKKGTPVFSKKDLFLYYIQASDDMRTSFIHGDLDDLKTCVDKWVNVIVTERYEPEMVREWVLKILLDIKLKFKSLQNFQTNYSVEVLHHAVTDTDTIYQLRELMLAFSTEIISLMKDFPINSSRSEIAEAQRFVFEHIHKKITLAEVSNHLYLNPSYFSRLFKKETGQNFIEYVTKMKIQRAKELLDQSNNSVEDISQMLGFENKSYFIRIFKSYVHSTPSKYREMNMSS